MQPTVEGVQHPLLTLSNSLFLLSLPASAGVSAAERAALTASIDEAVSKDSMAPFLTHLGASHGWKVDPARVAAMEAANNAALEAADAKIKEATEIAGDTEVREAMWARALLWVKWGAKDRSLDELNAVFDKTVGIASKLDVMMSRLRVYLAFHDLKGFKADLERAKILLDQGGDWERKNQLAVYESLYLILSRKFKEASKILLDAIATFTATELFSYREFVLLACLLSLISVERKVLSSEILKSPEILAVLDDIPHLHALLQSLYKCQYQSFFAALAGVIPQMQRSRYLAAHVKYYLRELRVVAYSQFLNSYKAASLAAMASTFGVSPEFMDAELFRFISAGRIHAKIDKVGAVVDTNRPDQRNQTYGELIKDGDGLLNRLHKLSKVIAL